MDSERSAAPPTIVGVNASKVAIAFAPALRVAIFGLSLQSIPLSASPRPGSGLPTQARSHSSASSGFAVRQAAKRSCHSAWYLAPSSFIEAAA